MLAILLLKVINCQIGWGVQGETGKRCTQLDYMLNMAKLKEPGDFKVVAGEDVVRCHQIESLVMRRVIRVNARGKDQMAKAVRE